MPHRAPEGGLWDDSSLHSLFYLSSICHLSSLHLIFPPGLPITLLLPLLILLINFIKVVFKIMTK